MKPSWRIQGRVYQLMTGRPIHWHVITKTKEPEALGPLEYEGLLQPLASTEGTHSLISTIAWQINDLMTRFGADDPWPVSVNGQPVAKEFRLRPTAIEYHQTPHRACMNWVVIRFHDDNVPADYFSILISCDTNKRLQEVIGAANGEIAVCATGIDPVSTRETQNSLTYLPPIKGRRLVGTLMIPDLHNYSIDIP